MSYPGPVRSTPDQYLLLCAVALALCCSAPSAGSSTARSPQDQSLAEYDIARDLWLNRGQPREALGHVLKALELDEENAEAEHLAALIYLDFCRISPTECKLEQAQQHAQRALEADPQFREARNTLGVVLIHRQRHEEAVRILRPLTTDILYQTPQNAWGNLGWALLEMGRVEEAADALERSVAAEPDFCVGYYRLALAYEKLKQAEQSLAAFSRSLDSGNGQCKGLQEAYAGRARVLIGLGRAKEAQSDLKACVRLDKNTDAGRECSALQAQYPATAP